MQSVAAAATVGQPALPKGTQGAQGSAWPTKAARSPTVVEEKTNFFPLNLRETSFLVQLEII